MQISKSLYANIVIQAVTKVTQALIYGKKLEIELGNPDSEESLF